MNNNRQNCEFSDQIVSFLYDEGDSTEKSFFKAHLPNCVECSNELTNFFDVRGLINDWREAEFSHLDLPQIVIPYHEAQIPAAVSGDKSSFSERFKQIFAFPNFKPILATAALLIAAVFIFSIVKISRQTDNLTAQADSKFNKVESVNSTVNPIEIASQTPESNKNKNGVISEKTSTKPVRTENTVPKILNVAIKTNHAISRSELAVNNTNQLKSVNHSGSRRQLNQTLAINHTKIKKLPTINSEDDGINDNSLRLAELFDDNPGN